MKQTDETREFLAALGKTIQKYRKLKGLTQEKLAIIVGSTSDNDQRSLISKIESGKRNPDAFTLSRIASALGVPATTLMNEAMYVQDETKVCELFERCYGKDAFKAVQLFLKLDDNDRTAAVTMMTALLATEKYSTQDGSKTG